MTAVGVRISVEEMTDLPDLNIRLPRDLKPKHTLAVITGDSVVEFRENSLPEEYWLAKPEVKGCKVWRFWDLESLHLFAAALMRDYRKEGVAISEPLLGEFRRFYDSRCVWVAWEKPFGEPLVW